MRQRSLFLILMLILACGLMAQEEGEKKSKATPTTIAAVLKEPEKFHKKLVKVSGKVVSFKTKVSQKKNPYTVFTLRDDEDTIHIYSEGHLQNLADGDQVTITGRFYMTRVVGSSKFDNEIDVSQKEGGKVEKATK
jgi:hypothetical protein